MSKQKFSRKSKIYHRARPSYPRQAIDYILSFLDSQAIVADIGSGTGKLTELLLDRGLKVFAVEPNEDMRAVAEGRLVAFDGFCSVAGCAEQTSLDDCCCNAVTVAQALHWFDIDAFRAECQRILDENGKIFVLYNRFDGELTGEYERFLFDNCPSFCGLSGGAPGDNVLALFGQDLVSREFVRHICYDQLQFVERALSSSYTPSEGDDNFEDFVCKARQFFESHQQDGGLHFDLVTSVYHN